MYQYVICERNISGKAASDTIGLLFFIVISKKATTNANKYIEIHIKNKIFICELKKLSVQKTIRNMRKADGTK